MPRKRSTEPRGRAGRTFLSSLGIGLVSAKVVLVPIVFDPGALVVFAQPKALLSHWLGVALLSVLVLHVISERPRMRWRRSEHVAVLLYVAISAVAAAFALDRVVALFGAHDRSLGLVTLLDNVVMYTAVLVFIRDRVAVRVVASALFVAPIALLGYEAAQLLGRDPLEWAGGFERTRPFAMLGNAGVLAQYLGTIACAALALAVLAPPGSSGGHLRTALASLAVLSATGALMTGTRAVIIGFLAGVFIMSAWFVWLRPTRRTRLLAAAGMGVLMLVGAAIVGLSPAGRAAQALLISAPSLTLERTSSGEGSVSGRLIMYSVALEEVRARPLLGVGPDNYVVGFGRYRPPHDAATLESTSPQTSPHSWIAKLLTDAGLLGLLSFAFVLATAVRSALRSGPETAAIAAAGSAGVAAFLGTGLVTVNDVGTEWLLWLGLAAMVRPSVSLPLAASVAAAVPRSHRSGPAVPISFLLAALVVVTLAMGALQFRALTAAREAEIGRQSRVRGQAGTAVAASSRAVAADPQRAEYWSGLGLGEIRAGNISGARAAFARAAEVAPYHATYLTNLVRAEVSLGLSGEPAALERAVAAARRAVEVDQNNPSVQYTAALAFQAAGRPAEAVAASERALTLDPGRADPFVYEVAARSYLDLGRAADAERWLRLGLVGRDSTQAVPLRIQLARALIVLGRGGEALAEVEQVLLVQPANPVAIKLKSDIDAVRR